MSSDAKGIVPELIPPKRPGKAGSKRAKNREERSRVLGEAAVSLFLEHGVERVTVDEITRRAGVAKGSFYRYFEDKAQLLSVMFAPLGDAMRQVFDQCERALVESTSSEELYDTYKRMAENLEATVFSDPMLLRLYLQECRAPAVGARTPIRQLSDEIAERAIRLTAAAHERGLTRDLPPVLGGLAVMGAVENLLFRFVEGANLGDPVQASRELVTLVLDGLGRHPR